MLVFGDARRAVIVGGIVVFVLGGLLGFALGRLGRQGSGAAAPDGGTAPPVGATAPAGGTAPTSPAPASPVVVTPPPNQEPGIATQGQVLAEGDRPVVTGAPGAPCQSLVSPGALGECGEVPVAGGRVIWLIERSATTSGATSLRVRLFTYVASAGGWVEWLQASDPAGNRWSDVNVLATDLTGDGVPELVVGFHDLDDLETLELDVVGYGQDGIPAVLAHPDNAARGVLVVSSGQLQEFDAQYPNGEPACCPSSYVSRTIVFDAGFFRVAASETVPPSAVPPSQI